MTRSAGTLFLFRKRDLRTSFIYAISLYLRYQPAGLGQLSMCGGWTGSSRTDSCGLTFGLALTKEPPYPEIIAGKGKGGSEEGWRIPNGHQGLRGRRSWLVPVEGIKRLHLPP